MSDVDIAYCDSHAAKTVLSACEGPSGVLSAQPNDQHDGDGATYPVSIFHTADADLRSAHPSTGAWLTHLEQFIPAPTGAPTPLVRWRLQCDTESGTPLYCFLKAESDPAQIKCPIDALHTTSSELKGDPYEIPPPDDDGNTWCHFQLTDGNIAIHKHVDV